MKKNLFSQKPSVIPFLVIMSFFLIGLAVYIFFNFFMPQEESLQQLSSSIDTAFVTENEVINDVRLQLEPDGAKVPLDQILDGCRGKDCIPSIDEPVFQSVSEADSWLEADDIVFVLTVEEETRIYPQRIMNWHEIVNDWFPSPQSEEELMPVAVTFCPLCGTAVAFERVVDGTITEFGVSGKLHNSDLIMYDRLEGSLWQQVSGEAISGPAARRDEVLKLLFLLTMSWEQASQEFTDADVLSRQTGFRRDYNRYPYGTYQEDEEIYFPVANRDDRLPAKEWVYGIEVRSSSKAYRESSLLDLGDTSFTDDLDGREVTVIVKDSVVNFEVNGERIVPLRSFWFAWAAFHPETELYQ